MDALNSLLPSFGPVRSDRVDLGTKDVECPAHGRYVSAGWRTTQGRRVAREIWSRCPQCVEVEEADKRRLEAEERAKERRRRLETMLERTGIPKRFKGKTFDSYIVESAEMEYARGVAMAYAEQFPRHLANGDGLVFMGNVGTGKSHLAAAILQDILPDHVGLYITCRDMLTRIRDTWRKGSPVSERQVMGELVSIDLLVLDEVGVQFGTENEQILLFEVMDRRYREQKPTVILTNADGAGLKDYLGERVYSRLREVSSVVQFEWADMRPRMRDA